MAGTSDDRPLTKREIFYFRQRCKNALFQAVVAHFALRAEHFGLTKKRIAQRLDKDPAQITRWLSEPTNLTLDTISDLLLAMNSELEPYIASLEPAEQGRTISGRNYIYRLLENQTATSGRTYWFGK